MHTHSAKAGAPGRLAAHRGRVLLIVHTLHGFPFHEFQNPVSHALYVGIERRLSRITDAYLAVGTGVAVEALRRGLARRADPHDRPGSGRPERRSHCGDAGPGSGTTGPSPPTCPSSEPSVDSTTRRLPR